MEIAILIVLAFVALWTRETLFPEPPKPKTPEEQLGEAIANYLKAGIKIRKE